ncbi:type IV secretion system protein VirD4 [Bradyrhizobium sp. cf659]|nr:type IV secretion system protein VirD4 [Bradyrhizobium sp. cf659]
MLETTTLGNYINARMSSLSRYVTLCGVSLAAALFGYPLAALTVHGFNIDVWPDVVIRPSGWFWTIRGLDALVNLEAYVDMACAISPAFPAGGLWHVLAIFLAPIAAAGWLLQKRALPARDPRGTFGNARWANAGEKAAMREGVELGIDPDTGRPLRVAFEGNFLTIAPPRTGKTSGLAIPNLWALGDDTWRGPSVVIDPKGQVFKAVAERRRAFGRRVVCLDPMNLVGGTDGWCPMQAIDATDVLYMQSIARALLPAATTSEGAYFQNRASDVIVTAMRAAIAANEAKPQFVSKLLSDPDKLSKHLASLDNDIITARVRTLLAMEARTRDPIFSTAEQAFQWCDDDRMQRLTNRSTFRFDELCRDKIDIFLTLPTEALEVLGPFIRWFLVDLFTAIRRHPPIERTLIFVDEARALGRFSELIVASGELPGYQASLWTFWQDRSQISAIYGRDDAATLLRTAEFVTLSDPASVDPDECDFWSRALSNFTLMQESHSNDVSSSKRRTSTTTAPTAARLMTAEELARLPGGELIVFPKSQRHAKRPLRLLKTRHDDRRFSKSDP